MLNVHKNKSSTEVEEKLNWSQSWLMDHIQSFKWSALLYFKQLEDVQLQGIPLNVHAVKSAVLYKT